MNDWWENLMLERIIGGENDAKKGVYEPPHPGSHDPQDVDENSAYTAGFESMRAKLGKRFKWA